MTDESKIETEITEKDKPKEEEHAEKEENKASAVKESKTDEKNEGKLDEADEIVVVTVDSPSVKEDNGNGDDDGAKNKKTEEEKPVKMIQVESVTSKKQTKKEQIRKVARAVRHQNIPLPKYQPKQVLMTDLLKKVSDHRSNSSSGGLKKSKSSGSLNLLSKSNSATGGRTDDDDVVVVVDDNHSNAKAQGKEEDHQTQQTQSEGTTSSSEPAKAEGDGDTVPVSVPEPVHADADNKQEDKHEMDEHEMMLEEKRREWEEEDRNMELLTQRWTAQYASGSVKPAKSEGDDIDDQQEQQKGKELGRWGKLFKDQEKYDASDPKTRTNTTGGVKRSVSSSLLNAGSFLEDNDDNYDIDGLLAGDTEEASEQFKKKCLQRKRRRAIEAELEGGGDSNTQSLLPDSSRSLFDEKSQQLLRRIHKVNVVTPPPNAQSPGFVLQQQTSLHSSSSLMGASRQNSTPSLSGNLGGGSSDDTGLSPLITPQMSFVREDSVSQHSSSLVHALHGLKVTKSPEPGHAVPTGALFRSVSSPSVAGVETAKSKTTSSLNGGSGNGSGKPKQRTPEKSRSLMQVLDQYQKYK